MDATQLLIPTLVLSHLIVIVASAFIGYSVGTRDSWDIIRDLQNRIKLLEGDDAEWNELMTQIDKRCARATKSP